MENDLLSPIRILFCGIEVYMLYGFFSAIFQKKWKGKKILLVSLMLTIIIFYENSFCSVDLNTVAMPILYFLYVLLIFKVSVSNAVAYTIIYYSFVSNIEFVYTLTYSLIAQISPFKLSPWYTSEGIYFMMVFYLANYIILLYTEKHIKKLDIGNNDKLSFYLLIIPFLSLVVSTKFNNDLIESISMKVFVCVCYTLFWISSVVIFIILEKYTDIMNKIKYSELTTIKRNMENEHLQKVLKINEDYRCYMHDIHSYFNNIQMLASNGDNKKIIELVKGLQGKIQEINSSDIYSSNPVLNAILSERVSMAKEKGVQLSLFIEKFLKVDFISDTDMISMFGNILDNAIEAAAKCNPENRKVNVKLFMGTNFFMIFHIKNSFAVAAKREGTRLLSTKADSSQHGLGIGIVKSLVDKYGGTLNLEEKEDLFITTLSISICTGENKYAI